MVEIPAVVHRLAAILVADVAGYSRLTEADEEGTLGQLKALRAGVINSRPMKACPAVIRSSELRAI